MTDWILSILATPYIAVPIVAWLWKLAKFPDLNWKRIFVGVVLTFAGSILQTLFMTLALFSSDDLVLFIISLINVASNTCHVIGLGIIGFYAIIGAFKSLNFR